MDQIHSSYNGILVVLSIATAILSSYVALELANIASDWRRDQVLNKWLMLSAFALGLGIWTMHFIGMFALQLPIPIYYEVWRTFTSLLIAIVASFVGFLIVLRHNDFRWAILGGLVMGLGIASMHFLGMSAMRLDAEMHYQPKLVVLSIFLAISVSILALWTLVTVKAGFITKSTSAKVLTAILAGSATSSMHYVGLAAMTLTPADRSVNFGEELLIRGDILISTLSFAAILLLLLPLFSVSYENRFSRRLAAELVLLRANESRLRKLIENAPDAFFVIDDEGKFLDVNRVACQQLGYDREELLSLTIFDIGEYHDFLENLKRIWPSLEAGKGLTIRNLHKRKDGSKFPVEINITGLSGHGSHQLFALARDITETEKLSDYLSKLAMTDELTGLYNRRAFMMALEKQLATASRAKRDLSVLALDIDYFKKINDKYGHTVGDVTLRHFADIVTNTIRIQDVFGRVGGEEFSIILPDTDVDAAVTLAERIRVAVDDTSIPNADGDIHFTVSIGVACFDATNDNSAALLKHADEALYEAKGAGRNQVKVFA